MCKIFRRKIGFFQIKIRFKIFHPISCHLGEKLHEQYRYAIHFWKCARERQLFSLYLISCIETRQAGVHGNGFELAPFCSDSKLKIESRVPLELCYVLCSQASTSTKSNIETQKATPMSSFGFLFVPANFWSLLLGQSKVRQ